MPITSSAQKALRQSVRRGAENDRRRLAVKKIIKSYKKALSSGAHKEAHGLLPAVFKALDKAAKSGVIKKTTAGRLKSRLSKKLRPGK